MKVFFEVTSVYPSHHLDDAIHWFRYPLTVRKQLVEEFLYNRLGLEPAITASSWQHTLESSSRWYAVLCFIWAVTHKVALTYLGPSYPSPWGCTHWASVSDSIWSPARRQQPILRVWDSRPTFCLFRAVLFSAVRGRRLEERCILKTSLSRCLWWTLKLNWTYVRVLPVHLRLRVFHLSA